MVSEAFVGPEGKRAEFIEGVERGGENLDVSPISESREKDILTKGRISYGFLGAAGLTSGATEG